MKPNLTRAKDRSKAPMAMIVNPPTLLAAINTHPVDLSIKADMKATQGAVSNRVRIPDTSRTAVRVDGATMIATDQTIKVMVISKEGEVMEARDSGEGDLDDLQRCLYSFGAEEATASNDTTVDDSSLSSEHKLGDMDSMIALDCVVAEC